MPLCYMYNVLFVSQLRTIHGENTLANTCYLHIDEGSWHVSMNAHSIVHILIVFISYFYFWIDLNWKIIQGKCKKPLAACLCDLPLSSNRYLYDLVWYICAINVWCAFFISFDNKEICFKPEEKKDFYDKIQEWTLGQQFIQ